MIFPVRSEDGECFPVDIGIPEASGFNDGPNVRTLRLEFALQNSRGSPLGHLSQPLRREPIVGPNSAKGGENIKQDIRRIEKKES